MIRVAIVDDEYEIREGMAECIDWNGNGMEVVATASDGDLAWSAIQQHHPDLVFIDIQMPGKSGLEVIEQARKIQENPPAFIILSGYDEFAYAQKAISLEVDAYLLKPFRPSDILAAAEKAIGRLDRIRKVQEQMAGKDFIVDFDKMQNQGAVSYPYHQEKEALERLKTDTLERCIDSGMKFIECARRQNVHDKAFWNCCLIFYIELLRYPMQMGQPEIEGPAFHWKSQSTSELVTEAREIITTTIEKVFGDTRKEEKANSIVSGAICYIHHHYGEEDLTLNSVAAALYVSPGYLSALFGSQMKIGFVEYIQQVRVEKAKRLLSSANLRLYEISQQVGYQNTQYFSQVFKKWTGITMREFRQRAFAVSASDAGDSLEG